LFLGSGTLAFEIVILALAVLESPAFWQAFLYEYDLGLKNSSLTRDQISEYRNNQILEKDNNLEGDLITVGFGTIIIVIGLISLELVLVYGS
jgi:hypothetical protein